MSLLSMSLLIGACGGGGGGDSTAVSPSPAPTDPSQNFAPRSGGFGGGQGRILYIDATDTKVVELDLQTRQPRILAVPSSQFRAEILGGVTRAANGRFAVLGRSLNERSTVYLYEADGRAVGKWVLGADLTWDGAVLSPDGNSVAVAQFSLRQVGQWSVMVHLLNIAAGQFQTVVLYSTTNSSEAHSTTAAWGPNNELYVLDNAALYQVDRTALTGTKLRTLDLASPESAMVAAGGREIWFGQARGNPQGSTIWSLDLASGQLKQRSRRSSGFGQRTVQLSPDGIWMLAQEGVSTVTGNIVSTDFVIGAVRLLDPPVDVANQADEVRDATGTPIYANGRMAWY